MPKVPVRLKAEPEVGAHTQHLGEPKGGVCRDAALAASDLVQAREGDPEADSEGRLRDAEWFEELLRRLT